MSILYLQTKMIPLCLIKFMMKWEKMKFSFENTLNDGVEIHLNSIINTAYDITKRQKIDINGRLFRKFIYLFNCCCYYYYLSENLMKQ